MGLGLADGAGGASSLGKRRHAHMRSRPHKTGSTSATRLRKTADSRYQRRSPQQIQKLLDSVASATKKGRSISEACLDLGISEASYYRWRALSSGGNGVGRRTRKQSRERIILAAKALFLREGRAVGLDSVANAAGVARQTLYNLFGNRDQLFSDVVHSIYADRLEPILHVDIKGDIRETLLRYARQVVAVGLDPEIISLLRLTVAELHDYPHFGKVLCSYAMRQAPALANYFRLQIEAGRMRPFDTVAASEAFTGALTSTARYRALVQVSAETANQLEAKIQFVVDTYVRGLCVGDGRRAS